MGLKRYKLGDLIEVTRGQSLAGEFYAEEGKYIRLTLGNFDYANGGFKPNTSKTNLYYTGPIKEQFILEEGDIITPLTEQTPGLLGSTARIPISGTYIQSQDVALVRCKDGMIDPAFCYYLLPSSSVKKQLAAGAQQTKIRHTSPDKIKDVVVDIPDISEQRRIGQLLDTITHKIELNRSINQNLEALAKQLYDYWFVQFDFPDENGQPYKSNGGKMVWNEYLKREIPKDWFVANYKELFTIGNGKTMPQIYGVFPAYGGNGKVKDVGESNYGPCIIIGRVGANCGSIHYSKVPCWVSDNAIAVCPIIDSWQPYLYYSLKLFNLAKNKGGSSQPLITHMTLKNLYFPISKEIVEKYACIANCLQNLIYSNQIEIIQLTKQRDKLLPLLMNGQVSLNSDLSHD